MNDVIKVKLVDLAAIELREAVTYPLKQCSQLLLVIGRNLLTRRAPRCLLVYTPLVAAGLGHGLKLQPRYSIRQVMGRTPIVARRGESLPCGERVEHRTTLPNVLTEPEPAHAYRHIRSCQALRSVVVSSARRCRRPSGSSAAVPPIWDGVERRTAVWAPSEFEVAARGLAWSAAAVGWRYG
jgi:hypothetical protein